MLRGSKHSVRARAADVSGHQIADLLRIPAECTSSDDRVGRVGVYIGDGKQIPVHAQGPALLCRNAAELLRVFQVPRGPKRHRMRKHGGSKKMCGKNASLKV